MIKIFTHYRDLYEKKLIERGQGDPMPFSVEDWLPPGEERSSDPEYLTVVIQSLMGGIETAWSEAARLRRENVELRKQLSELDNG